MQDLSQNGFYQRRTENGDVLAKDYELNGRRYRQETLTMGQLLELSDLLLSLEMPGVTDIADVDGINISVTQVIRSLVGKRMHGRALSIILCYEDGTRPDPDDFSKGTADAGLAFMEAVIVDFFSFNTAVSERLSRWFIRLSERAASKAVGLLQRAAPFITSLVGTSPAAQQSSTSGKPSPTNGRRKR